jgi:hypothetical protein
MGPIIAIWVLVFAAIRPSHDFGAYPDLGAPDFGFYSTLWLVDTPKIGESTGGFMIPLARCPQTWEHVGVMACAVKMLDEGGIGAGKPQLGRLKNPQLCLSVSDSSKLSCKWKPFPQVDKTWW